MLQIAQNRNLKTVERAEFFAHGEHIQKRLRGVLVHAVAAVYDACLDVLGKQFRRARHGVADNYVIHLHCVQRFARVDKRFPLLHRACRRGNIHLACAQKLARKLERGTRSGAVFVEKRDQRPARKKV